MSTHARWKLFCNELRFCSNNLDMEKAIKKNYIKTFIL